MTTERKPAKRSLSADEQRTASARRDAAFFEDRRAREAANLKRTLELRALRMANQPVAPAKPAKAVKPAKKAKAAKA